MQELSASQGQDMCVRGGPTDARGDGISGKRGKALGPGGLHADRRSFPGPFFPAPTRKRGWLWVLFAAKLCLKTGWV